MSKSVTNQQEHIEIINMQTLNSVEINNKNQEVTKKVSGEENNNRINNKTNIYRDLFENTTDASLIIKDGKFIDCNQATVNLLKYKEKSELLQTHPSELSPEKQSDGRYSDEKAEEMMRIAIEKGSHRFEWEHVRANGEIFPVEVLLTPIKSEDGSQIIHTTWRDLTDQKKKEKLQRALFNISEEASKAN